MDSCALNGFQMLDGVLQFLFHRNPEGVLLHRLGHAEGRFFESRIAGRARFGKPLCCQLQSGGFGVFGGHFNYAPTPRSAHGDIFLFECLHHLGGIGGTQAGVEDGVIGRGRPESERDKENEQSPCAHQHPCAGGSRRVMPPFPEPSEQVLHKFSP
ncbi:MAG: hypothetical protein KatS3mg021_2173 [Fimbriimonadales bacterium]|nr:MAG: hypothetical protein KatS3mg021_2173 [Fimbriimonadales bacterium]